MDNEYCLKLDNEAERQILFEFLDESLESLSKMDALLVTLESKPDDLGLINSIFRPIHTINGKSAFFGLMKVKKLTHETETVLDMVRKGVLPVSKPLVELLLKVVDEIKAMFARIRNRQAEVENEEAFNKLCEEVTAASVAKPSMPPSLWAELITKLDHIAIRLKGADKTIVQDLESIISALRKPARPAAAPEAPAVERPSQPVPAEAKPAAGAAAPAEARTEAKTMRISEQHIDDFLAFVGELIVVGEMFKNLELQMTARQHAMELAQAFRVANETFGTLSLKLQRSIMAIRKIPVRALLQKVPRLARDAAAKDGKDIRVVLEGESVEIDKSLIDLLDGPLTHIVRNAADHGIEKKERRVAAGKNPQGTIRVAVSETESHIVLAVEDDGGGIDLGAVRAKAEAMNLISSDQVLSPEEIINLTFMAGVSSAREVTDISGRGVGLDVVKQTIETAGGAVLFGNRTDGPGTRCCIQLPKSVTTEIMQGFIVTLNRQSYILPLERVLETVRVETKDITQVAGRGQCLLRHNRVVPLFSLAKLLGIPHPASNGLVVLIAFGKKKAALAVDAVVGVQQVVLKDIAGINTRQTFFDGGALMGDGRVALILNTDKLMSGQSRMTAAQDA